jgi:hypothetical protein
VLQGRLARSQLRVTGRSEAWKQRRAHFRVSSAGNMDFLRRSALARDAFPARELPEPVPEMSMHKEHTGLVFSFLLTRLELEVGSQSLGRALCSALLMEETARAESVSDLVSFVMLGK